MLDFDAGDAAGMDATSRVAVWGVNGSDHRTVGVPGDQDKVFFFGPVGQLFLSMAFSMIVFGRAGGVQKSQPFRRSPHVPHKETAKGPQIAV